MMPVFVGYDEREAAAINTCVSSIIRRASRPVSITYLAKNQINFTNPKKLKEGYPQSNAFIFSRFLIPYLQNFNGWALFIDGDMILLDDVTNILNHTDSKYAVMVVKHDYKTKFPIKYLGAVNQDYPRKNWSSVVLWNCGHPANKVLTKEYVENSTGEHLHRFQWLSDDEIGELPKEWNWLEAEYPYNKDAKLVHWTVSGPYFHETEHCDYSEQWRNEYLAMTRCDQRE